MNWDYLRRLATPSVILGALGVALLLLAGSGFLLWVTSPAAAPPQAPTAVLTVIPGPTPTPRPSPTPSAEPTAAGGERPTPLPGEIGLGSYVQITGTGGDGLNIRQSPSLSAEIRFLGYDSEVFEVRDGPLEADGFTWWYLVTPVDESRSGWAAARYLAVVANP